MTTLPDDLAHWCDDGYAPVFLDYDTQRRRELAENRGFADLTPTYSTWGDEALQVEWLLLVHLAYQCSPASMTDSVENCAHIIAEECHQPFPWKDGPWEVHPPRRPADFLVRWLEEHPERAASS